MEPAFLQNFIETARKFAKREVASMVGIEGRDGNLAKLPEILKSAAEIGLLAIADPESPGYEYGVWGRGSLSEGPAVSLAILEEIAKACAGVASCLHFAGLGALELAGADEKSRAVAVALFEDSWRLDNKALQSPPDSALQVSSQSGRLILSGAKSLVMSAPDCQGYVVYGAGQAGWLRVFVPADTPGLDIGDAGWRTGLAALKVSNLDFDNAAVDAEHALPNRDCSGFLRRLWLGLSAIAAGNARAALAEASAYAAERYQGGTKIINHPAIKILLGDASSRVQASQALLQALASVDRDDAGSLRRAAAAKLRISLDCCQAVTDSLQALGGYGYMEDYRLEKRLRDALCLKIMAGRPDDLRMFCAEGLGEALT